MPLRFLTLLFTILFTPASEAAPYYWRAFEVFPKKYDDGQRLLSEWTQALTNMIINQELELTRFQILQGALEMELDDMYRRLPISSVPQEKKQKSGERAIVVIARRDREGTLVGLHPELKVPSWKSVGDFNIVGRLNRHELPQGPRDHYYLDAALTAHPGPYSSEVWKKFFDLWVADFYSDEFGRGVPQHWQMSLPRLARELVEFVDVKSSVVELKAPNSGRLITVEGEVRMEALKARRREAYRYLRRLQGAFQLELIVHNPPYGQHTIRYDSKRRYLYLQWALGQKQVERGEWPKELKAHANVEVQLHGINVKIAEWPLRLVHNPSELRFEWYSDGAPKATEMQANPLMSLPLLMAKSMLHLDRDLEEFFQVLSSPEERQGHPNLAILWESGKSAADFKEAQFRANVVIPFRHSTLIKLGMGMLGHRLNPPEALLQEMESWRAHLFQLLMQDFEEVALRSIK